MQRLFQIIPGFLTWSFLLFLVVTIFIKPTLGAIFIIAFDLYWVMRVSYLTILLVIAHLKLRKEEKKDWLALLRQLKSSHGKWDEFYHAVVFPVYREPKETLKASLEALKQINFNLNRIMVVIALEERGGTEVRKGVLELQKEYASYFKSIMVVPHPDGLPGEGKVKGANTSWAARKLEERLEEEGIAKEKVILSCFDADTICHRQYFACLTYSFLAHPNPYRSSFQPIPVYNNNVWYAPSFARVIEISSSFWQLIQSMRRDRLVTFSSHSMSFKTLCEINFWPLDMVSDDSAIFWRALLYYDGNYHVTPMYVTVSMDVAFDRNLHRTVLNQYKQKRRWAWGVENFPMFMMGLLKPNKMPFMQRVKKIFQLLEEHFTWATWAIVLAFIGPLPVIFGGLAFQDTVLGYNLAVITKTLFYVTSISLVICILASFSMLPPKPHNVKSYRLFTMCTQWLFIPVVSAIIGSLPALDAQTRMLLGKRLPFWVTPKKFMKTH